MLCIFFTIFFNRCNRSGFYTDRREKVVRKARKGSCKIGGCCTAYIKCKEDKQSGSVTVNMCHTHYGHDFEPRFLRLPKYDRKIVTEKINKGSSLQDVVNSIKSTDSRKRSKYGSERAVHNMYYKTRRRNKSLQTVSQSKDGENYEEPFSDDPADHVISEDKFSAVFEERVRIRDMLAEVSMSILVASIVLLLFICLNLP